MRSSGQQDDDECATQQQADGLDEAQAGAQGVVLMGDDGNSWFVPVKVLNTDGGKAYITPVQTGSLTSGQTVRLFK